MSVPRGLSDAEKAAWARLAQSVTPMKGRTLPKAERKPPSEKPAALPVVKPAQRTPMPPPRSQPMPPRMSRVSFDSQLDSHWNRRLKAGEVAPDYTLDLHGHTLDAAYTRIIDGIGQARSMGARVVLVIAGRERGADPADRQHKRGAIRAKLLDWLAASPHADAIAAVRKAHQRHGGDGALYLVLRRGA